MKRFINPKLLALLVFIGLLFTPGVASAATASNDPCTPLVHPSAIGSLGVPTWYEYIKDGRYDENGKCTIPDLQLTKGGFNGGGILLVLLAIVDIALRIAALVALGFVIFGGIRMTISQGSPDKTKQAQSTITDALVGLVIAVIAIVIVSFTGNSIG